MSENYQSLAKKIVQYLGGQENITDAYHCQTRLRFKVKDEKRIDEGELEALDGVAKFINNAGVHQVVIGTHVKDVYEEVTKLVSLQSSGTSDPGEKKGPAAAVIDFVAGTFQPSGFSGCYDDAS